MIVYIFLNNESLGFKTEGDNYVPLKNVTHRKGVINEYGSEVKINKPILIDGQLAEGITQQELDEISQSEANGLARVARYQIERLSNDVRINAEIMIDGIDSPSQAREQFWAQIETVLSALNLGRPEMALPRMEGISRGNAPFSDVYDYLLSEITKLQEI